jgi:hypothetical protein
MNTFHQGLSSLVAQHAARLPCDALMRAAESLISINESVQLELPEIRASLQTGARFMDLDDSVHDRHSGLIWTKQTLAAGKLDFKEAEASVSNLRLDGVGGWRLPTIRELLTIVDYERHDPCNRSDLRVQVRLVLDEHARGVFAGGLRVARPLRLRLRALAPPRQSRVRPGGPPQSVIDH